MCALTIALQGGAEAVYLWGFDCDVLPLAVLQDIANENGTTYPFDFPIAHWTHGHVKHSRNDADPLIVRVDDYSAFNGHPVFNVSNHSRIPYFPKVTPEDALEAILI